MKNNRTHVYRYYQNNSGGWCNDMPSIHPSLGFVDEDGVNLYVYADTPEQADQAAENVGVYFDGISEGKDCSCCGDRWTRNYGELDAETIADLRPERLLYKKSYEASL